MEDNGWKVKTGPQKLQNDVEWHMQCTSYRLKSGPNGSVNRIYSFLQRTSLVQDRPEDPNRTNK